MGIVTDRDLVLKVIAEGRDPQSVKVQEIMTPEPISCQEDDAVEEVLELMEQYQVRRIPVTTSANELVGIISGADIAIKLQDSDQLLF